MEPIPIELFLPFIAVSLAMAIIAFLPREKQPFLMMLSGFMITFWSIMTDTIILGKIPDTSVVSGSTTTYFFKDNTFDFNGWPKILFALVGSILFFVGTIIWKNEEKPII